MRRIISLICLKLREKINDRSEIETTCRLVYMLTDYQYTGIFPRMPFDLTMRFPSNPSPYINI